MSLRGRAFSTLILRLGGEDMVLNAGMVVGKCNGKGRSRGDYCLEDHIHLFARQLEGGNEWI